MQFFDSLPDVPGWLLFAALSAGALYIYGSWPYRYWRQRGISGPRMLPFLEGMLELAKYKDIRPMIMDGLKRYGKVYGSYFMRRPVLVVADAEMVKQICVKRADNFVNRNTFGVDFWPLDKGILALKGQEWKRVRSFLTPTFSSGKMKIMYPLVEQCAQQLCESLLRAPDKAAVDIRAYFTNFTMDVVASTLFGLQINSQEDGDSEFKRHSTEIFAFDLLSWRFWATVLFPRLSKGLRIKVFKAKNLNFFQRVISEALREREASEDADKYRDFLAAMVTARREAAAQGSRGLTEHEVMAQLIILFLAGFETTANAMQYLAYFLAWHPDCQERARLEVAEAKQRANGLISYECVQGLAYMNQCLDEALRMCPPAPVTDRVCTETTVVNGYEIEQGVVVQIPIYGLAHDPDVWPDPETFNPDRFGPEASEGPDQTHLIPFGLGPRGCIGMRLAQMEIRRAMAELLLRVEFRPTPGVTQPFDKLEFKLAPVLSTKEPIRLSVIPRP